MKGLFEILECIYVDIITGFRVFVQHVLPMVFKELQIICMF